MTDILPPRPKGTEAVEWPEPAGSPAEYRDARSDLPGFRLISVTLTVELLEDPRRARYQYECRLETTGDVPARCWYYDVPADRGETSDVRGWDARGTLQTHTLSDDAGGVRLEVRMRRPVRKGESCDFAFSYESVIKSVVMEGGRSRMVSYADWVIFNLPCSRLCVRVVLPPRAVRLSAVPAPAHDEDGQVTYTLRDVRALETTSYMISYRRNHLGAPFYRWLLSAIGSGIIGALIALFVDGW